MGFTAKGMRQRAEHRKKTPRKYKSGVRKKAKKVEAVAAKDLAYEAIEEHLLNNEVDNLSQLCRDFGLSVDAVNARIRREDWCLPKRVKLRYESILGDLTRYDKIFRPQGMSDCDNLAIEKLRSEGVKVSVSKEAQPPEPKPVTRDRSKKPKSLSSKEIGTEEQGVRLTDKDNLGKDTSESSASNPPAVSPIPTKEPKIIDTGILSDTEQAKHDTDIANMARKSVKRAIKLGVIPISKVGDLRIMDDLFRKATHQKAGVGGGGRPIVSVQFLQQIGGGNTPKRQESVRIETSDMPKPSESGG